MSKVGLGIAAIVIVGIGLALANFWTDNDVAPAAGHSMEAPDLSDVAENGPIVEVVLPAELTSEARLGQVAFEAVCAD